MKIYIHHKYSESLFYKLAHNTTNKIFELNEDYGSVFCTYNGINFEFIFKKELSDELDGYHVLDNSLIENAVDILKNKTNWILIHFKFEKLYNFDISPKNIEIECFDLDRIKIKNNTYW